MKWIFKGSDKETEHRFLNFYTLHYEVDDGISRKDYSYFLASRNEKKEDLRIVRGDFQRPDAVLIGVYRLDPKKGLLLLLERQFRPSLNRDVISFPAGLMDPEDKGETETAKRECREETGFEIGNVRLIVPPSPTSEGLSDECNSVVIAEAISSGNSNKEEFEDISAKFYTEEEVLSMLSDPSLLFSNSARLLILLLLEKYGSHKDVLL